MLDTSALKQIVSGGANIYSLAYGFVLEVKDSHR